ncbi:DUF2778 domain-containing protein [Bosea minatitlanensis]|uniref:Tlde1 domain-containing protein n=1 Tax=Bosea minatitlanensis TaxID=128782 RepID=A0ABW0F8S3_9HYPH|nr:tlde1 domain-containing protein [Bosea minatitlanensis]MCT4495514.1 DUF2778 domain-containing protein [Bosea minatitlanensis]
MSYGRHARRGGASHLRLRRRRRPFGRTLFWTAALCLGAMTGFKVLDQVSPHDPNVEVAGKGARPAARLAVATAPERPAAGVTPPAYSGLLAPGFSGTTPSSLAQSRPVGSAMRLASVPEALDLPDSEPVLPLPSQAPVSLAEKAAPQPASRPADLIASLPPETLAADAAIPGLGTAPLPVPRPSELALPPAEAQPPRLAQQPAASSRRSRTAATAPAPTPGDNRNFFEKLFGVQKQQPAGPALAYAAPQDDIVDRGRVTRMSPSLGTPPRTAEAGTAIYDISARLVYLPNGERLEAHSGLGEMMDDPRYAHVRMKGVTPPHTYTLTEREALFHGVRAIRLNPVGGSGAIHGRAGLLAHSYLLGPRGDSNGCISFKEYDRFLQAYLRGEVKRIVVVASL